MLILRLKGATDMSLDIMNYTTWTAFNAEHLCAARLGEVRMNRQLEAHNEVHQEESDNT